MNVYATNAANGGYQFQGSFASLGEAKNWAEAHDQKYAMWWADEGDGPRPQWVEDGPQD
jgi:hypothetical protein